LRANLNLKIKILSQHPLTA